MIQECVQALASNPITSVSVALGSGVLLERFLGVVSFAVSFFQSRPAVPADVMAIIKDLQNKTAILPDLLKLVNDLKAANAPKA